MGTACRSTACAIVVGLSLIAPMSAESATVSVEAPQSADATARNRRGEELASQGRLDAALTEFRGAIELDPSDPQGHSNLGVTLAAKGQLDAGINELRTAIELAPDLDVSHVRLGIALAQQGRFDAAVSEFQQAIQINPNDPSVHVNLSRVLRAQGKGAEAEAAEQRARDLAGGSLLASPLSEADDVAELILTRPRLTMLYHLELDGPDHLVGRRALREVDLRKHNGVWSGWFGKDLQLISATADQGGDGEIKVVLRALGGQGRYLIRRTAVGHVEQVRGSTNRVFLSADATTLTRGPCGAFGSCLRLTSDDGFYYEGQYDGTQVPSSRGYRLRTGGHLTPAATAQEDPVLFVLLYVMGSSWVPAAP